MFSLLRARPREQPHPCLQTQLGMNPGQDTQQHSPGQGALGPGHTHLAPCTPPQEGPSTPGGACGVVETAEPEASGPSIFISFSGAVSSFQFSNLFNTTPSPAVNPILCVAAGTLAVLPTEWPPPPTCQGTAGDINIVSTGNRNNDGSLNRHRGSR